MFKAVESTCAGHADKVCDQIADAIVDEYLRRDPTSRVSLTVLGAHGMLVVGGEVKSDADFDVGTLAKRVYGEIGYDDDIEVFVNIEHPTSEWQSLARGTHEPVIVQGYATRETREMLPLPVVYAHALARRLDDVRRTDPAFRWLRPDGSVQVGIERGKIASITLLASHDAAIGAREVQSALFERVVQSVVQADEKVHIFINPQGVYTVDGFRARAGGSGRKLAVDTYGGLIPHTDAALSGRDPHHASRAGTYMARHAARWIVGQGLATSAVVGVVYAQGKAEPVRIEAFGVAEKSRGTKMNLSNMVRSQFDFRPEAIVERLQLAQPIYRATSTYGHMGRVGMPWEV